MRCARKTPSELCVSWSGDAGAISASTSPTGAAQRARTFRRPIPAATRKRAVAKWAAAAAAHEDTPRPSGRCCAPNRRDRR